jgi:hypothetical protein
MSVATAMAARMAKEKLLDRAAIGRPTDGPLFDSAIEKAVATGEAFTALEQLQNPAAEVNADALARWCLTDEVIDEQAQAKLAQLTVENPTHANFFSQNLPEYKSGIREGMFAELRNRLATVSYDELQEGPRHYLQILPACQEEANDFGVTLQRIFENDGLYARGIQRAYKSAEAYIATQKDWIRHQDANFEQMIFGEAVNQLRNQGKTFKDDWAMEKAVHKFYRKHPQYDQAMKVHHQENQQIARSRVERYWGEGTLQRQAANVQALLRLP